MKYIWKTINDGWYEKEYQIVDAVGRICGEVVMREKIERLEKQLEDCNKGYTMASQIAVKTAKKYLIAEDRCKVLEAENKELREALTAAGG
jgi:hypothetical protein